MFTSERPSLDSPDQGYSNFLNDSYKTYLSSINNKNSSNGRLANNSGKNFSLNKTCNNGILAPKITSKIRKVSLFV